MSVPPPGCLPLSPTVTVPVGAPDRAAAVTDIAATIRWIEARRERMCGDEMARGAGEIAE